MRNHSLSPESMAPGCVQFFPKIGEFVWAQSLILLFSSSFVSHGSHGLPMTAWIGMANLENYRIKVPWLFQEVDDGQKVCV